MTERHRWTQPPRRHLTAQVDLRTGRPDPHASSGFSAAVLLGGTGAWLLAGLTDDVVERAGTARLDPVVEGFAVAHRTYWLSAGMQVVTWLGSGVVLVPILLVATAFLLATRGAVRAAVEIWAAYLGGVALYTTIKAVIDRPRPPVAELITQAGGAAYPSGHATQAIATWGMLALVLTRTYPPRARAATLVAASLIVLVVGVSRIYLGAHWLTDVLAGYALGGAWIAFLLAIRLAAQRSRPAK
ncbi:phosphatase PAP2 family protein [Saccharopolyspora phatthalungensis]|uniref:Undecaprenyl-diphosphatase n=1 Tax=Saccharopolyspora phatthalungensis TaxID=664693 RepID=A0A840QK83_9PSEU|nr:phosphatase PAP2 family protein [Saccharopolyspora phatthalungensis]MBB5158663.1 undecaprenyl-diphosphatase [Saccharopolyspora phatthalungensis]